MALIFLRGVFQVTLSTPGVFLPWFSVTRLTARALPLNEWVKRRGLALTLPHLFSCVAFTILAWSRRTVWLTFCQSMACQSVTPWKDVPVASPSGDGSLAGIAAVICFSSLGRLVKGSRDERPCGSLHVFTWGDVAPSIRPITERLSLFPHSFTRHPFGLLTVSYPMLGKMTGLPCSVRSKARERKDPSYDLSGIYTHRSHCHPCIGYLAHPFEKMGRLPLQMRSSWSLFSSRDAILTKELHQAVLEAVAWSLDAVVPDWSRRHTRFRTRLVLLLMEDQQVVEACLSYTPGEAFADRIGSGAWESVLRISIALVVATRAKQGPNLRSWSQIRYFGACPYGVASRRGSATQGSEGDRVTPTWITRRDFSSMRKNAKSGRKKRSVTCRKSQDQIAAAWLCKKVDHFCPRGWGVRTRLMYFWIVRLHTCMPSFRSSPRIRSAPHSRFFTAISLIKAMVSAAIFGVWEAAFDLRFQTRRNSSRCHREPRVWLNNEKGLLPCANQPCQEHEECSVRLGASRPFHLPTENDERLS